MFCIVRMTGLQIVGSQIQDESRNNYIYMYNLYINKVVVS